MDEKTQAPVLILKDKEDEKVLPIWIGAMEAMAISLALNKVAFPRPMTHDLLLLVISGMDGVVTRVEITRLEEGTFYAELVLDIKGEVRRIDSRPSDAIAVAVRADAPVFVDETVLEEAGAKNPEAYEAVLKTDEAEKWTEELKKLDLDDTKYKM